MLVEGVAEFERAYKRATAHYRKQDDRKREEERKQKSRKQHR